MILLRRVIGDALRARRQSQHRTLREVSTAANVSLGYLSEIERGQKEASSELLAAVCDALGAQLSELLRDVSQTVEVAENVTPATRPVVSLVPAEPTGAGSAADRLAPTPDRAEEFEPVRAPALEPVGVGQSAEPVDAIHAVDGASLPASAGMPRDGAKLSVPGPIMLPKTAVARPARRYTIDGDVAVSVRQDSPLKATLRAKRNARPNGERDRDVVCAR